MINLLLRALTKISFSERYQNICKDHTDFHNRLDKLSKTQLLSICKGINPNFKYESLDRVYTIFFEINEYRIEFCSKLSNGQIQPYFYLGKDKEKLFFHRFDFICEKITPTFDRDKYNICEYSSVTELEKILKDMLKLFEDFKGELLALVENNAANI